MLNIAHINDPVIAINIHQQFEYCMNNSDLYECTRGSWRLNRKHAEKAKFAFAVYQGIVQEVYEIDHWVPVTQRRIDFWLERLKSQGRIIDPSELTGRSDFVGRVASEEVREKYVGKIMPVRHGQNPILYFNC
jgi:uncharacterized protein